MLCILSACNKDEKQSIVNLEDKTVEAKPTEFEETEIIEEDVYPLTGLKVESDTKNQRPIAVMVNNHPKARPQSGLHKADLVYEVLAEGNITRFLAVFQSDIPDVIGPVRSARDYYIDLSKGFEALYVHHGWSPSARQKLESGEADYLNGLFYDGTLFWRADHRKAPHNSYISFEHIQKGAKENNFTLEKEVIPFQFYTQEELLSLKGNELNEFVIKYHKSPEWQVTYEYDKTKQTYSRYSNNEQTVDLESGKSIELSNVFVVEMEHEYIDDYGRRGIDLISGGKAFLMQKGLKQEVEWKNIDNRIVPIKDGEIIKFVPGRTWINIVPNLEESVIE
ncbi:DUF3048 domain-containing protein [Metabacillus malikii]|uniref:Lipoprotein YerB n=1 Tax=Metabacillus malikii TaxID=1504265 RepID=A0ABT9ZE67_9BACI|nr:hypothetical protein [Metabacillus malikii]